MRSTKFLHFFPPPKLLEMPSVGIDISDRSVKWVELKRSLSGISLGRYGEENISPGVVESGVVKNPPELARVLSALRPRLSSKYVFASLPEEKAYLININLPLAARDNERGAVELLLEEHVPLPAAEVIFDYEIINVGLENEGITVAASVFPLAIAESYLNAFLSAGFIPLSFEIEAHALARVMIPGGEKGGTMIVDFGRSRTGFVVVSAGRVLFSSTVNIGGDSVVGVIEEKLGLTYEMAQALKERRGVSRAAEDKELYFAITPTLSVLRDEISKHYLYWNTHESEGGESRRKIERILMAGGDANIPGAVEYLSAGLDMPISIGNPWINIISSFDEDIPAIPANHAIRYATALGLALRRFF